MRRGNTTNIATKFRKKNFRVGIVGRKKNVDTIDKRHVDQNKPANGDIHNREGIPKTPDIFDPKNVFVWRIFQSTLPLPPPTRISNGASLVLE